MALVRRMRSEAGLSLRSLAERSDLAASTIHRVEHGELNPTVETLNRIASATGHAVRLEVVTGVVAERARAGSRHW